MLNLPNDGLTPCYCCLFAGLACNRSRCVSGYVTCPLVTLVKEYSGLGSLNFCTLISKFCCWRTCVKNISQEFIFFPLLRVFNKCMACSGLLYNY